MYAGQARVGVTVIIYGANSHSSEQLAVILADHFDAIFPNASEKRWLKALKLNTPVIFEYEDRFEVAKKLKALKKFCGVDAQVECVYLWERNKD